MSRFLFSCLLSTGVENLGRGTICVVTYDLYDTPVNNLGRDRTQFGDNGNGKGKAKNCSLQLKQGTDNCRKGETLDLAIRR